ncbi:MAG: hypothetical protein P8X52_10555, partial [Limibacillus sp.]
LAAEAANAFTPEHAALLATVRDPITIALSNARRYHETVQLVSRHWIIRDAIALEDLGIPAAPVITTEFVNETRLTRQAVGMPALRPVVIDHPVSSITEEEVAARVEVIRQQACEVWLGTRADI